MKQRSFQSENSPTRRRFLGQCAAIAAVCTKPRLLWGSITREVAEPIATAVEEVTKWASKRGPLMTRWSSLVDNKMPHPFYPRPQLVRKKWMNLNGIWGYQPGTDAKEAPPFGKTLASEILVPYPVESALSGVMEHHDRLWYRRQLAVPSSWRAKQVILHFGAIDYESEVFINGKQVGLHRGGYDPFHYDITAFLKLDGHDELIVRVFDPTEAGGQPRGKQNTHPRGITYTPTTGIWQTVWLEPVDATHIDSLTLVPDIDHGELNLTIHSGGSQPGSTVDLVVKADEAVVAKLSSLADQHIVIPIPNAKLWSPDSPFLYTLDISMKHGNVVTDTVSSYFGMRKIHVGDVDGQKKILLNNQFVFQIGPLDQGFWPDGIYTSPTDEALKEDIVQLKALGFNMVRKHIKVEPARWYYWADTLGLLVWQDMPSANSYPGKQFVPPPVDQGAFEEGLKRLVETHRNSPCIVTWIVFNEGQGQFDTERMVNLVRNLDASRIINEASGGEIKGFGDLNDVHSYPEPAVRPSNGKQAMVCGEYGGIGYLIADNSWERAGRGYTDVDTPADLLYLYAEFMEWVRDLRDNKNLSAVVYTELTDVMTEVNGLLTYDRVAKVPTAQIRRVNTFQFPAPTYQVVLPNSSSSPQSWKYILTKPGGDWFDKEYDDAAWWQGSGGFGNNGDHIGTKWSTPDIWLRRRFQVGALTAEQIQNLVMTQFYMGHADFYVNGIAIDSQRGNNRSGEGKYENRPLPAGIRKAIVPNGENVFAVHCHGDGEKQFFDAGMSIRNTSV